MATRPQEVRDLKWRNISADFGSVWFSSNKTNQARTVKLDPSISKMLKARRDRLNPKSDDELVFTSVEGLPIDNRNFCRRAWKTVLSEVGVTYRHFFGNDLQRTLSFLCSSSQAARAPHASDHPTRKLCRGFSETRQGLASDPIKYFSAPENQDLGVVKTIRKPNVKLIIAPFPEHRHPDDPFFFQPASKTLLTVSLQT